MLKAWSKSSKNKTRFFAHSHVNRNFHVGIENNMKTETSKHHPFLIAHLPAVINLNCTVV